MTIGKQLKKSLKEKFYISTPNISLTTGEAVRYAREFNELSQNELSKLTGFTQATISGIENDRIALGVERAKVLARALKVHPAILLFPVWDTQKESAA